jgi:hypothetical protein
MNPEGVPTVFGAEERLDDPNQRPPADPNAAAAWPPQAPGAPQPPPGPMAHPAPGPLPVPYGAYPAAPPMAPMPMAAPMPMPPYPQPPVASPGVYIAGLPGMPGVMTAGAPGGAQVTVISNVVGAPYPQPPPPAPYAPYPQASPPAPYALPPARPAERGAFAMMRDDAAQKTMEAVARGGPARVLGFTVAGVCVAAMLVSALLVPFAGAPAAVLLAMIPLALIAAVSGWLGARAGRGISSHHLEQAALRVASENSGVIRVVSLAQATGRPLRECQLAIDAMVASGHATVDADDAGNLVYRVPDLQPRKERVVYDATVTG